MAPGVAPQNRFILPSSTKYPAKGRMSSEGREIHADSIAIKMAMPPYPVRPITDLMKTKTAARIFSIMRKGDDLLCRNTTQLLLTKNALQRVARELERAFLGKCVSRKRSSVGGLRDFDANRGSIWSGHQSGA